MRVRWSAAERRLISLIVPTRASVDMVLSLVASLKECTRYLSLLRVHVVSNNSVAPQTERALAVLAADEIVAVSSHDVTRGLDSVDAGRAERVQESQEALVARLPRPDYADLAYNPHFLRGVRPFTAVAWPARETVLSWIDQQETRHAVFPAPPASGRAAPGSVPEETAGEGDSDPGAP